MGSSREAWRAGWNPKNSPTAVAVPSPLATDTPETRNSQPVNRQIAQVAATADRCKYRRNPQTVQGDRT